MRQAAKLFLDEKIGRRSFLSRLSSLGVAAGAAGALAHKLEAVPASATEPPAFARI